MPSVKCSRANSTALKALGLWPANVALRLDVAQFDTTTGSTGSCATHRQQHPVTERVCEHRAILATWQPRRC